jgi:hypothetical protein
MNPERKKMVQNFCITGVLPSLHANRPIKDIVDLINLKGNLHLFKMPIPQVMDTNI